jgi:hydrogenase assembly chaperone HypC/HupF
MRPLWYTVVGREPETTDTVTLRLRALDASIPTPAPGQFTMLYAFGVGEVPISVSGAGPQRLDQTLRAVGAVTRALHDCRTGAVVGVRGPFGVGAPTGRRDRGRPHRYRIGGAVMCLAYPARVRSVADAATAEVTVRGRTRSVVLLALDAGGPIRPGDWLLVQSGLAIQRLSAHEAHERQRLIDDLTADPTDHLIGGDDEP